MQTLRIRTALLVVGAIVATACSSQAEAQTYALRANRNFKLLTPPNAIGSTPVAAPRGSTFEIRRELTLSNSAYVVVVFKDVAAPPATRPTVVPPPPPPPADVDASPIESPIETTPQGPTTIILSQAEQFERLVAAGAVIEDGNEYVIDKLELTPDSYHMVSGAVAGVLSLPYKWQLSDGSLTSGSTVGFYYGYMQRWLLGLPTTGVLSLGVSAVPTSSVDAASVDTRMGFTGSMGLITSLRGAQAGLLIGFDHIGDSGYKYDGNVWMSLSIGFNFVTH